MASLARSGSEDRTPRRQLQHRKTYLTYVRVWYIYIYSHNISYDIYTYIHIYIYTIHHIFVCNNVSSFSARSHALSQRFESGPRSLPHTPCLPALFFMCTFLCALGIMPPSGVVLTRTHVWRALGPDLHMCLELKRVRPFFWAVIGHIHHAQQGLCLQSDLMIPVWCEYDTYTYIRIIFRFIYFVTQTDAM